LPQRAFDSVGFKRVPALENAFTFLQALETRIGPSSPEKFFDLLVTCRQRLCDKAQGEMASEIKLALVRYRKVAVRGFEVVRYLLVERLAGIGSPPDFARIERDIVSSEIYALCSIGAAQLTKSNAMERSSCLTATMALLRPG